jgi:hypothetical protein
MQAHPLDCAFERVYRANERLRDLRKMHISLKREHDKIVVVQFQAQGGDNLPNDHFQVNMQIPMSFGICMGEICYNLRTALEYLVFELAKSDSGARQDGTQFPIEDTRKGFEWRLRRGWLKDISSRHVAAIERLQPYKGCKWSAALRDLSNKDKHRELPTIRSMGELKIFGILAHSDPPPPSIFRAKHPISGKEMNMSVEVNSVIAFDDGAPIIETLDKSSWVLLTLLRHSNRSSSEDNSSLMAQPLRAGLSTHGRALATRSKLHNYLGRCR